MKWPSDCKSKEPNVLQLLVSPLSDLIQGGRAKFTPVTVKGVSLKTLNLCTVA